MKSTALSKRSITRPPEPEQVEIVSQLKAALLALRDMVFEMQEASTRLSDATIVLHKLVQKMEAMAVTPDLEAGHGR